MALIALGVGVAAVGAAAAMSAKGAKEGAKGEKKRIEGQNTIAQQSADSVRDAGSAYKSNIAALAEQSQANIKGATKVQTQIANDRAYMYQQLGNPKYFDKTGEFGGKVGGYGGIETSAGTFKLDEMQQSLDIQQDTTTKNGKTKVSNYWAVLPNGQRMDFGKKRPKRKGAKDKNGPISVFDLLSKDDQHKLGVEQRLMSPSGQSASLRAAISHGLVRGAAGLEDPMYNKFVSRGVTSSLEQANSAWRASEAIWNDKLRSGGAAASKMFASAMARVDNLNRQTAMHMDSMRGYLSNLQVFALGNDQAESMWGQMWITGDGQGTLSKEYSQMRLALDTFWSTNIMPILAAAEGTGLEAEIRAAGIESQMQTTAGRSEMQSAAMWNIAAGATGKIGSALMSYGAGGMGGGAAGSAGVYGMSGPTSMAGTTSSAGGFSNSGYNYSPNLGGGGGYNVSPNPGPQFSGY